MNESHLVKNTKKISNKNDDKNLGMQANKNNKSKAIWLISVKVFISYRETSFLNKTKAFANILEDGRLRLCRI